MEQFDQITKIFVLNCLTCLSKKEETLFPLRMNNATASHDSVLELDKLQLRLKKILATAIRLDNADMGNIQIYDEPSESLHMIIQKGFDDTFLKSFHVIKPFSPPSCGRAIGLGIPITIDDVLRDASLRPVLSILKFRSVRSIPILDSNRSKLGVISTHSKEADHEWVLDNTNPLIKEITVVLKEMKSIAHD